PGGEQDQPVPYRESVHLGTPSGGEGHAFLLQYPGDGLALAEDQQVGGGGVGVRFLAHICTRIPQSSHSPATNARASAPPCALMMRPVEEGSGGGAVLGLSVGCPGPTRAEASDEGFRAWARPKRQP